MKTITIKILVDREAALKAGKVRAGQAELELTEAFVASLDAEQHAALVALLSGPAKDGALGGGVSSPVGVIADPPIAEPTDDAIREVLTHRARMAREIEARRMADREKSREKWEAILDQPDAEWLVERYGEWVVLPHFSTDDLVEDQRERYDAKRARLAEEAQRRNDKRQQALEAAREAQRAADAEKETRIKEAERRVLEAMLAPEEYEVFQEGYLSEDRRRVAIEEALFAPYGLLFARPERQKRADVPHADSCECSGTIEVAISEAKELTPGQFAKLKAAKEAPRPESEAALFGEAPVCHITPIYYRLYCGDCATGREDPERYCVALKVRIEALGRGYQRYYRIGEWKTGVCAA